MAKLGPDNNFTAYTYMYTYRERFRDIERERQLTQSNPSIGWLTRAHENSILLAAGEWVANSIKVIVFFAPFFAQFWLMFRKHYKNRYFSTFLKAKNWKNIHFEVLLSGPSRCYYLGQVDCNLKMANLAQIITPQICARNFFVQKKVLKPLFYSVFDKQCFVKSKLGPDNNTSKGQTWPR